MRRITRTTCQACVAAGKTCDACTPSSWPFVHRGEPRTKRDRINRLRERLNAAETVEQLRSVMQGLLDLLGDEL